MEREYYVSERAIREAIQLERSFNAIHVSGALKVDVLIAGSDPFDRERLERRERLQVREDPSAELFIDTAEDSLLRKLESYRRGGDVSERQWRDVVSILRAQRGRLDTERLDRWAPVLAVSDLLERAMPEAEPDRAPAR